MGTIEACPICKTPEIDFAFVMFTSPSMRCVNGHEFDVPARILVSDEEVEKLQCKKETGLDPPLTC